LAIRVKAGIFTGIVAVAAIVGTACSGGSDRIDSSLPPPNVLNNLAGVYRKASIAGEGKSVTCPDFERNGANLGSPNSELIVNGIVVDTCSTKDELILGPTDKPGGTGRYRIVSLAGTEDGNYHASASQLILTRDLINGAKIAPAPLQRVVMSASFNSDGTLTLTPASQPVSYSLKTGFTSGFNPDGTLNGKAITPTVDPVSKTTNVIVLPRINDYARVNRDLTISVGPVGDSREVIDPPGYPRVRAIVQQFVKRVYPPDADPPPPTPAPAPR
jgi:hypothetical protein